MVREVGVRVRGTQQGLGLAWWWLWWCPGGGGGALVPLAISHNVVYDTDDAID